MLVGSPAGGHNAQSASGGRGEGGEILKSQSPSVFFPWEAYNCRKPLQSWFWEYCVCVCVPACVCVSVCVCLARRVDTSERPVALSFIILIIGILSLIIFLYYIYYRKFIILIIGILWLIILLYMHCYICILPGEWIPAKDPVSGDQGLVLIN